MDIDAISDDDADDLMYWALETGIWNGYVITKENGEESQVAIAENILAYLSSQNPDSYECNKLTAELALLGANERERDLVLRDIEQLHITKDGIVVQAGFGKALKKFWKKHKKEILIGLVVVAVAVTVVCSAGAAAPAAMGGGAAINRIPMTYYLKITDSLFRR